MVPEVFLVPHIVIELAQLSPHDLLQRLLIVVLQVSLWCSKLLNLLHSVLLYHVDTVRGCGDLLRMRTFLWRSFHWRNILLGSFLQGGRFDVFLGHNFQSLLRFYLEFEFILLLESLSRTSYLTLDVSIEVLEVFLDHLAGIFKDGWRYCTGSMGRFVRAKFAVQDRASEKWS